MLGVKLMMAGNDLQLANEAAFNWKQEQPKGKRYRQIGARMYFVRLQMAHLNEALKVIDGIRKDAYLSDLISSCDSKTRASFRELEECLKDDAKYPRLRKILVRTRSNLTFHYDEEGKLITRAISDMARRAVTRHSPITRGNTGYLWYFQAADEVVRSILVNQILGIAQDKDDEAETDEIMDELLSIFLTFTDFAGEFIWRLSEL